MQLFCPKCFTSIKDKKNKKIKYTHITYIQIKQTIVRVPKLKISMKVDEFNILIEISLIWLSGIVLKGISNAASVFGQKKVSFKFSHQEHSL